MTQPNAFLLTQSVVLERARAAFLSGDLVTAARFYAYAAILEVT